MSAKGSKVLVLLLLSASANSFASYRVHKLKLIYLDASGKVERTAEVLSTLDHYQYEHYHADYGEVKVEMLDTWFCPGDTRLYRKYCEKPKVRERSPSSTNQGTRILPYNFQPVIP